MTLASEGSLLALASPWNPSSHAWEAQHVAGITIHSSEGGALVLNVLETLSGMH